MNSAECEVVKLRGYFGENRQGGKPGNEIIRRNYHRGQCWLMVGNHTNLAIGVILTVIMMMKRDQHRVEQQHPAQDKSGNHGNG